MPSQAEIARYANDLLMRRYRADAPGGAVLVARGDTLLFRAARGEADVAGHVPLRPDSVFRIGSVTKQFAAAGLLKLVEAGTVKLEDPLSKYVPDYPGGDRISVLQLLNHTSGIRSYTSLKGYMDGPVRRDLTTAQMIQVFRNETPPSEPGAKWEYNNSGYVLVGAVIEAASGQPWHAYLDRVFFKPLGMRHTGYALDPSRLARQVKGYSYEGDKLVPARPISMTQPHAAGALVSNVDDLFRWNRALHEGRVLQSATYAQMITPVGKAVDVGYGFGLFDGMVRRSKALWHGGGIFGFISSLNYLPGPDISVVVLENDDQDNDRIGGDSADIFARRLAAKALGDPYPAMQAVAVGAAILQGAEGVYRFDGEVRRILRVVDGKLTSQRGARGEPQMLTPIAADDFLYPDGFNRLRLERDASGRIARVRFFPGGDGDGEVGVNMNEPLPSGPAGVQVPRVALERLVGAYVHPDAGLTLKVYFDRDALLGQIAGQNPVTLRAKSPTEFDVEETGASIAFPAGNAPAAEATIRQKGREILLKRVP
uniref:serine hydrolase domain-containing protein n=1 Tax=Sphingomonas bacterium TaxID=1895847 RepID=UPI002630C9E8|nr:serine hydrolase domain-containing protein [Sphingomonas bacterium]